MKAISIICSLFVCTVLYAQEMKFVMAHKPDNQDNIALINKFSERVKQRTNGKITIRPVMPQEVIEKEILNKYGPHKSSIQKLYTGEFELAQISAKTFTNYSNEIDVLDAPLVFKNHEHAAKVLDGAIGEDLIKTVALGSNDRLQGLAFTYSGGFRNFFPQK